MKWKQQFIGLLGMMILSGWCGTGMCDSSALPQIGGPLPLMHMTAPPSQKDCDYLGVDANKAFQLDDVNATLIMVEIIGVYCPQCHKQRPHINRLFHRIQKDPALSKKVKFIGIAVGATPMEVAYLVKESRIPYPIITDERFEIHKQLGEPRTPFNMVTSGKGKVLWTHLGTIEDMNAFFATIKSFSE